MVRQGLRPQAGRGDESLLQGTLPAGCEVDAFLNREEPAGLLPGRFFCQKFVRTVHSPQMPVDRFVEMPGMGSETSLGPRTLAFCTQNNHDLLSLYDHGKLVVEACRKLLSDDKYVTDSGVFVCQVVAIVLFKKHLYISIL